MVTTEIVTLSIVLGLILVLAGTFVKNNGSKYLSLFGGILIIVTSIIMLVSPLQFPVGTETVVNSSTYTTTITYASQSTSINMVLSLVLMFVGAMASYFSISHISNSRYEDVEYDNNF